MVLSRLFKRSSDPIPAAWRTPEGERIYAIGDIHGRLDAFEALLARIDADSAARGPATVRLILLGDLVDRGPDSKGVVERAMALGRERPHVTVLKGNHEELLLRTLGGDRQSAGVFARHGGRETLISYGVDEEEYDAADLGEMIALAAAHVPQHHIDYLEGLERMARAGDYVFVHAGIRPGVPLDAQRGADLRWIRADFTADTRNHGAMIVHGHTITEEVDEQPNRIGIDTGAYATGRLTAIGLEGEARWFLSSAG